MSSWVWYALVLAIIMFSVGFGLGAVWAGHMGAFRQGDDDANAYRPGSRDEDIR